MSVVYLDKRPEGETNEFIERDVSVPEWGEGCVVKMRTATSAAYAQAETRSKDRDTNEFKCRIIAVSAIKPDGTPVFPGQSDVHWLMGRSAAVINRLWDAAVEVNGMRKVDDEALEGN